MGKKFNTFRNDILKEAVFSGSMGDARVGALDSHDISIDGADTPWSFNELTNPKFLERLNSYVSAINDRLYADPSVALNNLQYKLQIAGLSFVMPNMGIALSQGIQARNSPDGAQIRRVAYGEESEKILLRISLLRFGGRFGVTTNSRTFQSDSGFSGDAQFFLELEIIPQDGLYEIYAKIVEGGEERIDLDFDSSDDLQEENPKKKKKPKTPREFREEREGVSIPESNHLVEDDALGSNYPSMRKKVAGVVSFITPSTQSAVDVDKLRNIFLDFQYLVDLEGKTPGQPSIHTSYRYSKNVEKLVRKIALRIEFMMGDPPKWPGDKNAVMKYNDIMYDYAEHIINTTKTLRPEIKKLLLNMLRVEVKSYRPTQKDLS